MLIPVEAYKEIEKIVGPENITADEQICDTYSQFLFQEYTQYIVGCCVATC